MAKAAVADIRNTLLELLPKDGSSVGNQSLRDQLADRLGAPVSEVDYFAARDALVDAGMVRKGKGRGGSVARISDQAEGFSLAMAEKPADADAPKSRQAGMTLAQARREKAEVKPKGVRGDAEVIAYRHDQKRRNNPDVGVVTPDNDPEQPKTQWAYDPHIDPALQFDVGRAQIETLIDNALSSGDEATMRAALEQLKRQAAPYLNWTGKAESTSFEVDTVSLHVHERIDPASILAVIQKRMKADAGKAATGDMFRAWFEEPLPLREAVDFYKHDRGWSNRLVAGDSLLVMNSLLQKEGMAGQVQMIYIDPPYGIKYGSNFQPFVNKRDVKDRKDEDLTQEPEMIKAFRDTWEMGIHSYLTYLRDRLLLAKELLHESGSVFVQISDENLHHVREICDELFGAENLAGLIPFKKTSGQASTLIAGVCDYLVWYAKDKRKAKYRQIYAALGTDVSDDSYNCLLAPDGSWRRLKASELRSGHVVTDGQRFRTANLTSQGESGEDDQFDGWGQAFLPSAGTHWKPGVRKLPTLQRAGRLIGVGKTLAFKRFSGDFPVVAINNMWSDTIESTFVAAKMYVVQTSAKVIERCLLMTTDPGDLVLDPTCGSGTTAYVAEKWGRRWITCDTSRVAVTLAKQRLMTASYDYYDLKYPHEGLRAGFIYKTVPHVTLKSIANNPEIDELWERMHPAIEAALGQLNAALAGTRVPFKVTEGGRKGEDIAFDAKGTHAMPTGEQVPANALLEWEVPFDFPADWPASARGAFDDFHAARQAMQRKMDDSIASHADQEVLYDQPQVAKDKLRITGPFTVEAVPFPSVMVLDEAQPAAEADASIARSGESARQHRWRDELLKAGIRGKGGQMLRFAELESLPDTPHLHCTGHLDTGERVVVCFGPEHAALEQRTVELAMREAGDLFPRPKMIVFCAFAFDPEAAKDIDATKGITALKAQMNTDLLTEDLKKNARHNQSFWLMGQPEVEVRQQKDGRYVVEVHGFDYFDTADGKLVSGGKKNIAAWSLDTDYDERSLFPRQVFFPMAGKKDGWHKLKRDIKAELDESKLDKLHGTVSLPFEAGENRKIAVKIVDDRGIESLKVMALG
ncbi:MAG TPA: site-specific DNA-methyltransferase [Dokdonella sp.]|uniref:site-specific DNA-methyltransferase n=1 Tax=Dokdonella sp. TaxID=2291710 RepID=UPI002B58C543|nr:site-specific DNA-methyltransferase [Dokdonella sp.]HUD43468.1 site-specific DNA-methyltransferase [Dokdonella sp.]